MGWDKRGYYYSARKVNGRVVRDYIGKGAIAQLAAQMDAVRQQERELAAQEKHELAALDLEVRALSDWTDLLARAALLAAGYHQHKRGEWRKTRGQHRPGDTRGAEQEGVSTSTRLD
jgi:hypothetical protein